MSEVRRKCGLTKSLHFQLLDTDIQISDMTPWFESTSGARLFQRRMMGVYSHIKLDAIYARDVQVVSEAAPPCDSSTEPLPSFPKTPRYAALAGHLKRYGRAGLASIPSHSCFGIVREKLLNGVEFNSQGKERVLTVLS